MRWKEKESVWHRERGGREKKKNKVSEREKKVRER